MRPEGIQPAPDARPARAGPARGGAASGLASRLRTAPRGGRAAAAATWLSLALCAVAALWLVADLERRVEAEGFQLVDPSRIRSLGDETWFDPRWRTELELALTGLAPFETGDRDARRHLIETALSLSFAAEVTEPVVVWPDGLSLDVRPYVPVACVMRGDSFLAVAPDGTLLSGEWPTPPRRDGGWLPVIGPNDGSFDRALPGDVLTERHHLDALAVARSLWEHLDATAEKRLGRILIDARRAPYTAPEEPGIVLRLEDARDVCFGRSPDTTEPGELPVATKWRHLSEALAYLADGDPRDEWVLLDARWDRAEVVLSERAEALRAEELGESAATGRGAGPGWTARDGVR